MKICKPNVHKTRDACEYGVYSRWVRGQWVPVFYFTLQGPAINQQFGWAVGCYLRHYNIKLTARSWVFLEKPPVAQLLKNFPKFYETGKFITVFTRALHWSLPWAIPCNICGKEKFYYYVFEKESKKMKIRSDSDLYQGKFLEFTWNITSRLENVRPKFWSRSKTGLESLSGHVLSWLKFSQFSLRSPCEFR
jgi:hypothetical protein